jgi:hypothetical protein
LRYRKVVSLQNFRQPLKLGLDVDEAVLRILDENITKAAQN